MSPRYKASRTHDAIFGGNIRELRIRQGMSENALGAKIGVNQQQISKYEAGTASFPLSRLPALRDALGATVDEVFRGLFDSGEAKKATDLSPQDLWATRTATRLGRLPRRHRQTVSRLIDELSAPDSNQ